MKNMVLKKTKLFTFAYLCRMAQVLCVLFSVAAVSHTYAAAADSTTVIFDDTRVHAYYVQFYDDNWVNKVDDSWVDTLDYYYTNGEAYIPARVVYVNSNGDSVAFDSVGVRYKGNSSYVYSTAPRKPFKFSFDEYRDQRFYGVKKLNFSNAIKDPTQMREKIAYDIIGNYMPSSRAAFANIYVDNKLVGLYTQIEQVDKRFLKRKYVSSAYNLYKASDNGAPLSWTSNTQADYESLYELQTNDSVNDWSAFVSMLDKLNNTPAESFVSTVGGILDIDKCLRYLAFNMALSNFDSYTGSGRNYYMYDDSSAGKFTLIPWDLNFAFGIYTNGWNVTTVDIVNPGNVDIRPLMKRLLENDSLKQVYLSYVKEFITGPTSIDSITAKIDKYKTLIDPYVQADTNSMTTYAQFTTNIESDITIYDEGVRNTIPGLKSFITKRNASLETQLTTYLPAKSIMSTGSRHTALSAHALRTNSGVVLSVKYDVSKLSAPVKFTVHNARGAQIAAFNVDNAQNGICQLTKQLPIQLAPGYYTLKMDIGTTRSASSFVVW